MLEDEVKLNRLAQGIERAAEGADEGADWFRGLSQARRREVLAALPLLVAQAHPLAAEAAVAIRIATIINRAAAGHGPNLQLTYKVKGKTITLRSFRRVWPLSSPGFGYLCF